MDEKTVTISKLHERLSDYIASVEKSDRPILITKRGKPVAVLTSFDDYDSLWETVEVFSDEDTMATMKQVDEEVARGDYITGEQLHKELVVATDK